MLRIPAIALGFTGLAFYQLAKGELFASATSLFFYALMTHQMNESQDSGAPQSDTTP